MFVHIASKCLSVAGSFQLILMEVDLQFKVLSVNGIDFAKLNKQKPHFARKFEAKSPTRREKILYLNTQKKVEYEISTNRTGLQNTKSVLYFFQLTTSLKK